MAPTDPIDEAPGFGSDARKQIRPSIDQLLLEPFSHRLNSLAWTATGALKNLYVGWLADAFRARANELSLGNQIADGKLPPKRYAATGNRRCILGLPAAVADTHLE